MDSGTINLSTGPVKISAEVKQALGGLPMPHRSEDFCALYHETADLLKKEYNTRFCFLLTGSGTLANEVMLHQLTQRNRGLIISNGEFGDRLIDQATRIKLDFIAHKQPWGKEFEPEKIEHLIEDNGISWMAFTHCETSTGVINDLETLVPIAGRNNCQCYVDCMSTIGTRKIDLTGVTMATASSGKALASIPGLAIVFSNVEPVSDPEIPSYLDLGQYFRKSGVPFTISSNLVAALNTSVRQKLSVNHYRMMESCRERVSKILSDASLVPFDRNNSFVFTLAAQNNYELFLDELRKHDLVVSYESEYLKKRNWIQLALFNFYSKSEMEDMISRLESLISKSKNKSQRPKTDLAAFGL